MQNNIRQRNYVSLEGLPGRFGSRPELANLSCHRVCTTSGVARSGKTPVSVRLHVACSYDLVCRPQISMAPHSLAVALDFTTFLRAY